MKIQATKQNIGDNTGNNTENIGENTGNNKENIGENTGNNTEKKVKIQATIQRI